MKLTAKQSEIILIACLILINALSLFPLLTTGFIADDILNSQIRGHMIQTDCSLWGVTTYYMNQWLKTNCRLFPLAFSGYSIFYFFPKMFCCTSFLFWALFWLVSVHSLLSFVNSRDPH